MANVDKHDPIQGKIIHEYDGIEEADNGLPRWLTAIFFGATAFAVLYWFYYEEYEIGQQPAEAYAAAMAEQADSAPEVSEEALRALADDPEALSEGEQVFVDNCAQCHKADGGGQIGPNLTDHYWIHGGSPTAIHEVIRDGVAAKGMPAWGPTLGPEAVQKATAYVLSLRGEDVEGGKEPEGDEWVPEGLDAESQGSDEPAPSEGESGQGPEETREETREQGADETPEAPADAEEGPTADAVEPSSGDATVN